MGEKRLLLPVKLSRRLNVAVLEVSKVSYMPLSATSITFRRSFCESETMLALNIPEFVSSRRRQRKSAPEQMLTVNEMVADRAESTTCTPTPRLPYVCEWIIYT